jgi:glycosyltransferase involved in cell wall biosynthesis
MRRRVLGFISCYNESDIIEDLLRYYEKAGVPVVFIDNGSTDGSGEIAQRYQQREVLEYVRHETDEYDIKEMLNLCLAVVERHHPDWIMHIDADHFYEPGQGFASFHDHVNDAEARECNVIDFEEYAFLPTTADDPAVANVYERMKYYAFRAPDEANNPTEYSSLLLQPRLYRYQPGMNISNDGGHTIFYVGDRMRIHPVRGILRHYLFRSVEQGRRKLRERRARYSRAGRARGWHTQYDTWGEEDATFNFDPNTLTLRMEGAAWSKENILLGDGSVQRVSPSERFG